LKTSNRPALYRVDAVLVCSLELEKFLKMQLGEPLRLLAPFTQLESPINSLKAALLVGVMLRIWKRG
jgi:hypothetical protein